MAGFFPDSSHVQTQQGLRAGVDMKADQTGTSLAPDPLSCCCRLISLKGQALFSSMGDRDPRKDGAGAGSPLTAVPFASAGGDSPAG